MNNVEKSALVAVVGTLISNEVIAQMVTDHIGSNLDKIDAILKADGTEAERKEAVVFAIDDILLALELAEVLPPLGVLRTMIADMLAGVMLTEVKAIGN